MQFDGRGKSRTGKTFSFTIQMLSWIATELNSVTIEQLKSDTLICSADIQGLAQRWYGSPSEVSETEAEKFASKYSAATGQSI